MAGSSKKAKKELDVPLGASIQARAEPKTTNDQVHYKLTVRIDGPSQIVQCPWDVIIEHLDPHLISLLQGKTTKAYVKEYVKELWLVFVNPTLSRVNGRWQDMKEQITWIPEVKEGSESPDLVSSPSRQPRLDTETVLPSTRPMARILRSTINQRNLPTPATFNKLPMVRKKELLALFTDPDTSIATEHLEDLHRALEGNTLLPSKLHERMSLDTLQAMIDDSRRNDVSPFETAEFMRFQDLHGGKKWEVGNEDGIFEG